MDPIMGGQSGLGVTGPAALLEAGAVKSASCWEFLSSCLCSGRRQPRKPHNSVLRRSGRWRRMEKLRGIRPDPEELPQSSR